VNDQFVSTLGFNKAVNTMRGEPGTKVKLLVIQEGEPKPKEIELTREVVTIKAVKANLEKNNVAYVRITTFNENTIVELKKAISNLNKEGIKGIILDLRNNPGGLLDQAVAVSEYFINSGVIVTIKGRTPNSNTVISSSPRAEKSPNVPMVVLINSGSASASEIVAGAMQDHRRAVVLGTKSFGKGSVQTLTQISPRAAVKLTTAKYYTPNNRSIQAEGIEPDITIEVAKVEYPENNGIEKRFSEYSLRNYLKNDKEKVDNKKANPKDNKKLDLKDNKKGDTKDNKKVDLKDNTNGTKQANETVKNKSTVKEGVPKSTTETEHQLSDLYKKDYQFARAYDLIVGLILVNDNEKSRKNNKTP
jgi:carboxyl-terminal processing protease